MFRPLAAALTAVLAIACTSALAAPATTAAKADDPKTELAIQLMQITNFDQMMATMRQQVSASIEQSMGIAGSCASSQPVFGEFTQALADKLSDALTSADFKVDVASVYAETFDEQELRDIIAFYQSPLGRKMLAKMPELMQRSTQISQERIKAIMPDVQAISEHYRPLIQAATQQCDASAAKPAASKKATPAAGH
jgi:uncharacterized protein